MGDSRQQQETDQIDRLNQVAFDFSFANLSSDPRGKAGHAGEGAGDHRQQVVGDHFAKTESADCRLLLALGLPDRIKDRVPKKNLGDDRQEPHQRPKRKVASVHQSFLEGRSQDRPPQRKPPSQPTVVARRGDFISGSNTGHGAIALFQA